MTVLDEQRMVDWLSVEFACNGTRMHLASDPVTLEAAILRIGHMLTVKQIAERCGTHPKRVSDTLRRHGAEMCPICRRFLLCTNWVAPRHVTSNGWECDMSGWDVRDSMRVRLIRATSKKLARTT